MQDHGKKHRQATIAGTPQPGLSLEAKRFAATQYLGNKHVLAGGNPDWSRPTVLPAWIASRTGATSRIVGL